MPRVTCPECPAAGLPSGALYSVRRGRARPYAAVFAPGAALREIPARPTGHGPLMIAQVAPSAAEGLPLVLESQACQGFIAPLGLVVG